MYDIAYKKSIDSKLEYHSKLIEEINSIKSTVPIWTTPTEIGKRQVGISSAIGVYKIIYKPTMEIKSIGQGNISNRRARHIAVFRNGGSDIIHTNGSTSGSITGQKMFKHDSNIDNWLFSFCNIGVKSISSEYEFQLQQIENPEFNNLNMGGNN